jgi:hypothetical protein
MPAVQSANAAAATTSRDRIVVRQSGTGGGSLRRLRPFVRPLHGSRNPLLADHDVLVRRRLDQPEVLGGNALDAARRAERLDLQLQMPVHFFFRRPLLLEPLHEVAVAHELEVLPRGEEQHEDEDRADRDRSPELTLPCLVDLADDRSCEPLNRAQLRAASSWVPRHLVVARLDRPLREDADGRLAMRERAERVLHDAILQ